MNLEHKVLICYNEPTRYYDNYLGKDFSNANDNVDLSEREFMKQIVSIKNVLSKKYISVETLAVNSDIKLAMKKILNYSPILSLILLSLWKEILISRATLPDFLIY